MQFCFIRSCFGQNEINITFCIEILTSVKKFRVNFFTLSHQTKFIDSYSMLHCVVVGNSLSPTMQEVDITRQQIRIF